MKKISTKLYVVAFGLTALIFIAAISISFYINLRKTAALKGEEDGIAINILSLENQSDVLTATIKGASAGGFAVSTLAGTSTLRGGTSTAAEIGASLDDLQSKLAFMQNQLGPDNPDLFRLERYYSLLEIKDYLLEQALAKTSTSTPLSILYFYGGTSKTCSNCLQQEYILEAIKQQYPQAHVYSFDYSADLTAVQSFIPLHNLPTQPPAIIINGTTYPGFASLSDAEMAVEKNL